MKKYVSISVLLLVFTQILTSCEVVGGIFKAGFWTGIILVALLIIGVMWLVSKSRKKTGGQ